MVAHRSPQTLEHHEPTHAFWLVCSYGDAGMLRTRTSQPVVHFSVRRRVCAGISLRVSTGGLAVRARGGCLVDRGSATLVDGGTGQLALIQEPEFRRKNLRRTLRLSSNQTTFPFVSGPFRVENGSVYNANLNSGLCETR